MDFFKWQTTFDQSARSHPEERKLYIGHRAGIEKERIRRAGCVDARTRLLRLDSEYRWIKAGRPFYNVYPSVVPTILRTKLDSIPAKLIELPENFPVVNIRFSKDFPFAGEIAGILFTKFEGGIGLVIQFKSTKRVLSTIDIDFISLRLPVGDSDTIPEALQKFMAGLNESVATTEHPLACVERDFVQEFRPTLEYLFRIAIIVGFLADAQQRCINRARRQIILGGTSEPVKRVWAICPNVSVALMRVIRANGNSQRRTSVPDIYMQFATGREGTK